jgi:hypothetical protein
MKIADETINILKNFSTINEGIMIRKGKILETISKEKNILARAEVVDSFDEELGLYDINSFLGTLSMNGNEIEFNGTTDVIIKGFNGKSKTKWRKTPENMIVVPPNKSINMDTAEISFELTEDEIKWFSRAASMLSAPNIVFASDGQTVEVKCFDIKNDASNINTTEIDAKGNGKKYNMIFSTDNLKFIEGSYDVKISSKGISYFKHKKLPIEYWIMTAPGSKYEG